jgi:hypothetical protein
VTPSPNGARWPEPRPLANPGRFIFRMAGYVASLRQALALPSNWPTPTDALRLSLADRSAVRPHDPPDQHTGSGQVRHENLDTIADRLGADDHHGGKRVWFELRLHPQAAQNITATSTSRDHPKHRCRADRRAAGHHDRNRRQQQRDDPEDPLGDLDAGVLLSPVVGNGGRLSKKPSG